MLKEHVDHDNGKLVKSPIHVNQRMCLEEEKSPNHMKTLEELDKDSGTKSDFCGAELYTLEFEDFCAKVIPKENDRIVWKENGVIVEIGVGIGKEFYYLTKLP